MIEAGFGVADKAAFNGRFPSNRGLLRFFGFLVSGFEVGSFHGVIRSGGDNESLRS